jgi:hypothetical protein
MKPNIIAEGNTIKLKQPTMIGLKMVLIAKYSTLIAKWKAAKLALPTLIS